MTEDGGTPRRAESGETESSEDFAASPSPVPKRRTAPEGAGDRAMNLRPRRCKPLPDGASPITSTSRR